MWRWRLARGRAGILLAPVAFRHYFHRATLGFPAELPVAPSGRFANCLHIRNDNLEGNSLVERHHVVVTRPAVELAHHGLLRALGDLNDAAFHPAFALKALGGPLHVHFDAVAVQG